MSYRKRVNRYHSWGRYPSVQPRGVKPVFWRHDLPNLSTSEHPVLPFGFGKSYGDSCLSEGGILLDVTPLNRFISFDEKKGILRCEAGVSLAEILDVIVPRGWFLPVVPGTKFVSVGGAIANDIHGKNHHNAGTFGCHVTRFELVRSSGRHVVCSPRKNGDLFQATIGGLGLTGLILWAEFKLKSISNPFISQERIRFANLQEFFDISKQSDKEYEYTVAWIDCLAHGKNVGRGIFILGNHDDSESNLFKQAKAKRNLRVPFDFPAICLNRYSMRAFNKLYYYSQFRKKIRKDVHYNPFFFPLDSIEEWNRIYGKRGFLQYQCLVPSDNEYKNIRQILTHCAGLGEGSFLAVLKKFGNILSPGLMSFPRAGTTLTLDFPFKGEKTLKLLEDLDEIVRNSGGAVYPAKDARMTPESFQVYFPNWKKFENYIDPKFRSRFWQRVTMSLNGVKHNEIIDRRRNVRNRTRDREAVC